MSKYINVDTLKTEINEALKNNYNAKEERIKALAINGITYDDEFVNIINGKILALHGINNVIDSQPIVVTGTTETTCDDGWIPAIERLPYDHDYVLCTDKDGEVDSCASDWFIEYKERYMAWMPLPEPYKESDKP